jgi:hypothetical protein
VETLEGRQLLSAVTESIVPKQIELFPGGQISFDGQMWHNGAVYALNGKWSLGSGNTYKLTNSGTLTRTTSSGTTNTLGTNVLDFAIDYDGTLWVLFKTGQLDMQVGSLATSAGLFPIDYEVSFLEANYDLGPYTHPGLGGDVYALDTRDSQKTLRDMSLVGHSGWANNGLVAFSITDFSFGTNGNLYILDTSHDVYRYGFADGSDLLTEVMTNAYLNIDWQNPYGGGLDYRAIYDYQSPVYYPTYGTNYGNHYHGMEVYGTPV